MLLRDHYLSLSKEQCNSYKYLNLILENGIYRCQGRLPNSHLGHDAINPILLIPNHNLTKLLIRHTHKQLGHQGVGATLAELQTKYWIPKGRQAVKNILRHCIICKKVQGLPFRYPGAPALPSERVRISRPFENVGIDYAGPFLVRSQVNQHEKRWICLLACMSTRAIHLETVNGLSALEFVAALRRFIARRGTPHAIFSDNATTFTAGHELIRDVFEDSTSSKQIDSFVSNQGITWKFITPLSPWKGGFYERLIGSVKKLLKENAS